MSVIFNDINKSALDYTLSQSERMQIICDPLKYLGITYFGYYKFFKSGRYISLHNVPEWAESYGKKGLVDRQEGLVEAFSGLSCSSLDCALWPEANEGDILSCLYDLNITNGISLHIREKDSFEAFAFATTPENIEIKKFYIKDIKFLKRFTIYFREKAKDIINTSDYNRLAIQSSPISFVNQINKCSSEKDSARENFLKKTSINKFYLSGNLSDIYLTKREAECINHLGKGKTFKEVATFFGLSPRTVQDYIEKVRIKTNISNTSKLIDVFLNSPIKEII